MFQIFRKNQLEEYSNNIDTGKILPACFIDHCFINCLKYFKISDDIIYYSKDIILDILSLKDLNKICTILGIIVNVSFVNENRHCHTPKKYGLINISDSPKIITNDSTFK
jgi:hypothetical protein